MKIKRIEHVAIAVNDMADSMKILENIFGFELELEEKIGSTSLAMYPIGETYIELLESDDPKSKINGLLSEKEQSLYHLCFEVDDIFAEIKKFQNNGARVIVEPVEGFEGRLISFILLNVILM